MIEINLLPGGSGKKKSSRGGGGGKKSINLGAAFANLAQKIKDPWLLTAMGSVVVAAIAVGGTYAWQTHSIESLSVREQKGLEDSTRFSAVLRDRVKAEAKRDTLLRRMNLIRAIDEDRFIWPHVFDEVSKALPPYTWLSSLAFMGTPQGSVNVAAGPKPAEVAPTEADKAKPKKAKKVDVEIPRDEVRVRMIGLTPDLQALTRFMRQLEASPFFQNVQLNNSQFAQDQTKDVTQFTLDVTYSRPDTSVIRRVPISASVK